MTDDNQKNDEQPAKVIAKAPEDKDFPKLKKLTHQEMYNLIAKFIQKAIPIKGTKLSIVKGMRNRVSTPKAPFIVLQVTEQHQLSSTETRYTDKHKILWYRSQVTVDISFFGSNTIPALEMAQSFVVRFNDAWASEQFEKYEEPFFPLYSDDVRIEPVFTDAEDQIADKCSTSVYFEYHPEFGICTDSGKEIIMDMNLVDSNQ